MTPLASNPNFPCGYRPAHGEVVVNRVSKWWSLAAHSLINAEMLVKLLNSYNILYCLSKHNHYDKVAQINQTDFYPMKGLLNGAFTVVDIASGNVHINSCGGKIRTIEFVYNATDNLSQLLTATV